MYSPLPPREYFFYHLDGHDGGFSWKWKYLGLKKVTFIIGNKQAFFTSLYH